MTPSYPYGFGEYSESSSHKLWRVYRTADESLVCVTLYRRGAMACCAELNLLAGEASRLNSRQQTKQEK